MRIGIFTQWYDPEPGPARLMGVLARELAARGHEVHVLTGFPNYPSGRIQPPYKQRVLMREVIDGVHVTRVPLYMNHDRSSIRRILNYLSFGVSSAAIGVPRLPKLDVVWVNYSPITLAFPMWAQQLGRGTPTVCEVADLWPDTVLVSGLSGAGALVRLGGRVLNAWCNAMYRSADAVTYISPSVGAILADRGVDSRRLHFIPKPADEQIFHSGGVSRRGSYGISDSTTVLVYAGALGEAQGLDTLIDAAARVADEDFLVLLAGSGTHEEALRARASELGVTNVRFLGRLSHTEMTDLYATADLAYISLASHPLSNATMPSKTQAILASGTAALVAAEGDVADVITAASGFTAAPGDVESIADAIRRAVSSGRPVLAELGQRSRQAYDERFSVARTTDTAEALLSRIAGAKRPWNRRLRPTSEASRLGESIKHSDARALARLHRRAFPDFFLSQLGESFLVQFYRGYVNDPTAVVAVERDHRGEPIGVVVGSTEPEGFFGRLLRRRLLGFGLAAAGAALRRPAAIPRLLRAIRYRGDTPSGSDGALLSSICVDPEARAGGVGSRLLSAWAARARELGATSAYLLTDAHENEAVNSFYVRNGWVLRDTVTTPEGRVLNRYARQLDETPKDAAR
ncbi:GNAT family N-acetyltransferase [Microbacterium stercoris]|uniref:D-inositol 3-phosphate glycosyltransferase n=1 Tax=Microbacterium stercoris TaxID=2820289 RepID=A0A939TQJ3_9MICO|nr:GNAT family N-acetyltransferase [Microbacterium stercoris]MBO3663525.1 GNAT family N-acetyltransferase [Microbacterium stercoris]